ncbi:MAG: NADH-quinone oxidoreductase subunit L [Rhodospirillales bacterium]
MLFATAVFAPLIGAVLAGLPGRALGDRTAQLISIAFMVLASVCGVSAWVQHIYLGNGNGVAPVANWIVAGDFRAEWALQYDTLSTTMVAMVTVVSTLIHIYSVGYMAHEHSTTSRFFGYLSLFSFSMLMLVTANNLVQLFFGWEGVGLCSYLLIGYWYDRPSACAAAIKAMIVNRIGDLAFAVGIAMIFFKFGAVDFSTIFAAIPQHVDDTYHVLGGDFRAYEVIGVLLFIGAMGKSAQIFLHTWLPDAMEGPTPVSALIHAATMVTAGVFLISRMSPLMEFAPGALAMVTVVGATTCFFAATVGCVQNDIKRVIAYSTCSQLGYMFMAAGVGAYQVSIFHLIMHAFFKALLFLCAGSVIHAMSDEQDMRRMGGIWRLIPITYVTMWIGSLALGGIPPFAGYYSKDAILEAAFASGSGVGFYGFACGTIAAFLTAFYSGRLLFMTFHGKPRADAHTMEHVHESPATMWGPLVMLAIGAVAAGWWFEPQFIGEGQADFWQGAIFTASNNHELQALAHLPFLVDVQPALAGLGGFALATWFYILSPEIPGRLAQRFRPIYLFLLNKWYFDELYDAIFVRPSIWLARELWQVGDAAIIDGVPNGVAALAEDGAKQVVRIQTGSIAVYAFTMLVGVVALVSVVLVTR